MLEFNHFKSNTNRYLHPHKFHFLTLAFISHIYYLSLYIEWPLCLTFRDHYYEKCYCYQYVKPHAIFLLGVYQFYLNALKILRFRRYYITFPWKKNRVYTIKSNRASTQKQKLLRDRHASSQRIYLSHTTRLLQEN